MLRNPRPSDRRQELIRGGHRQSLKMTSYLEDVSRRRTCCTLASRFSDTHDDSCRLFRPNIVQSSESVPILSGSKVPQSGRGVDWKHILRWHSNRKCYTDRNDMRVLYQQLDRCSDTVRYWHERSYCRNRSDMIWLGAI